MKEAEDLSTVLFHLFKALSFFTPLFGAALSGWFTVYRYCLIFMSAGKIGCVAYYRVPMRVTLVSQLVTE